MSDSKSSMFVPLTLGMMPTDAPAAKSMGVLPRMALHMADAMRESSAEDLDESVGVKMVHVPSHYTSREIASAMTAARRLRARPV